MPTEKPDPKTPKTAKKPPAGASTGGTPKAAPKKPTPSDPTAKANAKATKALSTRVDKLWKLVEGESSKLGKLQKLVGVELGAVNDRAEKLAGRVEGPLSGLQESVDKILAAIAKGSATTSVLSVGRLVHVQTAQGTWRPALVLSAEPFMLRLFLVGRETIPGAFQIPGDEYVHQVVAWRAAWDPKGVQEYVLRDCPEGDLPGCWRWPPRN